MKLLIPFLALLLVSFSFRPAKNPLSNTTWSSMGFKMHFHEKDTASVYMEDELVAQALYTATDSILTWQDITVSEMSCDPSIIGKFGYKITDDVISFRLVEDACEERGAILSTIVLKKE